MVSFDPCCIFVRFKSPLRLVPPQQFQIETWIPESGGEFDCLDKYLVSFSNHQLGKKTGSGTTFDVLFIGVFSCLHFLSLSLFVFCLLKDIFDSKLLDKHIMIHFKPHDLNLSQLCYIVLWKYNTIYKANLHGYNYFIYGLWCTFLKIWTSYLMSVHLSLWLFWLEFLQHSASKVNRFWMHHFVIKLRHWCWVFIMGQLWFKLVLLFYFNICSVFGILKHKKVVICRVVEDMRHAEFTSLLEHISAVLSTFQTECPQNRY